MTDGPITDRDPGDECDCASRRHFVLIGGSGFGKRERVRRYLATLHGLPATITVVPTIEPPDDPFNRV